MKKETLLFLPMLLTIFSIFIISFYTYFNLTNAMLLAFVFEVLAVAIIFLIYFKKEVIN